MRRRRVYRRSYARVWTTIGLLLALLGVGGGLYWRAHVARYAILVQGRPLSILTTRQDAEAAIFKLKQKYAAAAPGAVTFKEGDLTIVPVHGLQRLYGVNEAVAALDAHLTPVVVGYAIYVNHTPLALLGSEEAAWQTISLIQARAAQGQVGVPSIKERITIRPYRQERNAAHPVPVYTPDAAAEELGHPPRPQYYTVTRGDSFYAIAMAHGLTVEIIKGLNPDVDPGALQPGDIIRLPDVPAPITVVMRPTMQ